jgi:hypothetical protein
MLHIQYTFRQNVRTHNITVKPMTYMESSGLQRLICASASHDSIDGWLGSEVRVDLVLPCILDVRVDAGDLSAPVTLCERRIMRNPTVQGWLFQKRSPP